MEKEIRNEQSMNKELQLESFQKDFNNSLYNEAFKHYLYNAMTTLPKEKIESNKLLNDIFDIMDTNEKTFLFEMSDNIPVLILGVIEQLYYYVVKQTKSYDKDKYTFESNFSDFLYTAIDDLDYDLEYLLSFISPLDINLKLMVIIKLYEFCHSDKIITRDNLSEAICDKRLKVVDRIKDLIGLEYYTFDIYMDDDFDIMCDYEVNTYKDANRYLKYYFKLSSVGVKNKTIESELDKLFMDFHDNTINLSEFGEIEAPFYDEIPNALKKAILEIAKIHVIDILIQELYVTDECQLFTYYIYQYSGNVIEGPSINDTHGCSFDYSDQEYYEDIFDEDGLIDIYNLQNMIKKCSIEVYYFCQKYNLEVTQKEINDSLPTFW